MIDYRALQQVWSQTNAPRQRRPAVPWWCDDHRSWNAGIRPTINGPCWRRCCRSARTGAASGVQPSAADQRHTVAHPHRRPVAGCARTVRPVGSGLRPLPSLAAGRNLGPDRHRSHPRRRRGADHLGRERRLHHRAGPPARRRSGQKGDLQAEPPGGVFTEPADHALGRSRGGLTSCTWGTRCGRSRRPPRASAPARGLLAEEPRQTRRTIQSGRSVGLAHPRGGGDSTPSHSPSGTPAMSAEPPARPVAAAASRQPPTRPYPCPACARRGGRSDPASPYAR